MRPVRSNSFKSRVVIRKPEITKKTRTPKFAISPSTAETCRGKFRVFSMWPIRTNKIDTARNPSSEGMWDDNLGAKRFILLKAHATYVERLPGFVGSVAAHRH